MARWMRDEDLPLRARFDKAKGFIVSTTMAPWHLRHVNVVGSGVRVIGRPVICNHGRIEIGEGVVLRSVVLPLELETKPGGKIIIGARCSFNYGVSIGATQLIEIGQRVRMGPYAMVIDSNFHDPHDRQKRPEPMPVHIKDDVWIGAKASVMPGVTIGRGSIIGAHALVNRNVPPFSIAGGVPAKVIGKLDENRFVASNAPTPTH